MDLESWNSGEGLIIWPSIWKSTPELSRFSKGVDIRTADMWAYFKTVIYTADVQTTYPKTVIRKADVRTTPQNGYPHGGRVQAF